MPKLMIVDDEHDVREYLKSYFKRRKIDVVTAESGEEALSVIDAEQPDLMLLDVKMGGITGVETLQRIRKSGNRVKVIIVTGAEDQETLKPLSELEIAACIHKPLILEELEKEVLTRIMTK